MKPSLSFYIAISVSIVFILFLNSVCILCFYFFFPWRFMKFCVSFVVFRLVSIVLLIPFLSYLILYYLKIFRIKSNLLAMAHKAFCNSVFDYFPEMSEVFFLWLSIHSLNSSNMVFLVFFKHVPISRPLQLCYLYLNVLPP